MLCTSSTEGLYGMPVINYQQYGPFFRLKNTICTLSSLLLRIIGRMHCELRLTLEHCYNIVRNTLILNMTKPGKRVFRFSDFQTAVQQKLVSTIWSLFIETYAYNLQVGENFCYWLVEVEKFFLQVLKWRKKIQGFNNEFPPPN